MDDDDCALGRTFRIGPVRAEMKSIGSRQGDPLTHLIAPSSGPYRFPIKKTMMLGQTKTELSGKGATF
ncbi:MAG: hypothetical protein ABSA62_12325 [Methyloceanibacter sp.]